ncbi:hypothetical protein EV649_6081 [Kribbella sp. VKM Ac-2569]|uniref:hypothetical protein n=1 Tax=Kribbella sp. VKM Ac-2569 TaxID=2512220 RepID=UPI00102AF31F|nr:hypothetical protein [Kribbella sp. VKM Ac-2569]RZT15292.1 hypothetical protein EV649_6081 [Kribbella sp. VKM Ac-2569]
MTKPTRLTDEELGDLLRETFAERETLTDHLPAATKRRSPVPVLLAAAAVLVVLVGVLYGVHRPDRSNQPLAATPAATAADSEDGSIWAAATVSIVRLAEPSDGWQFVQVFGQGQRAYTQMHKASPPPPVVTFSAAAKTRIEAAVRPLAPVTWGGVDEACTARRVATVTLGPVVSKAGHQEVHTSIFYDCGRGSILTYRIEKVDGSWKVTGTVGGVTGVLPVGGCPSASPREGC